MTKSSTVRFFFTRGSRAGGVVNSSSAPSLVSGVSLAGGDVASGPHWTRSGITSSSSEPVEGTTGLTGVRVPPSVAAARLSADADEPDAGTPTSPPGAEVATLSLPTKRKARSNSPQRRQWITLPRKNCFHPLHPFECPLLLRKDWYPNPFCMQSAARLSAEADEEMAGMAGRLRPHRPCSALLLDKVTPVWRADPGAACLGLLLEKIRIRIVEGRAF